MSVKINSFAFAEFFLDVSEKTLFHSGAPVALTPKSFELLLALVENHGRLVEKNVLMSRVWEDSFVEEGNLAYTMRLLRKSLGDDTKEPRFIETVPRRGYRFIAEVREIESDKNADNQNAAEHQISERVSSEVSRFRSGGLGRTFTVALPILVVTVIVAAFWYKGAASFSAGAPILNSAFASQKLSTNGEVQNAAISPDGKTAVYVSGSGSKPQSVWIRQIESGNNVQLIAEAGERYGGVAFSPDGNFIYFSRAAIDSAAQYDVYRLSIFGGIPQKIVGETQGWVNLSPDGSKISFVRCFYSKEENCALWMTDSADGKNERKLATRTPPFRIADQEFSPDGTKLAFAAGQSENQSNEFALFEIDLDSGIERQLTDDKFFNIKSLVWLPGSDGVLLTASQVPNKNFRIWRLAPGGEAAAITNDSENYSSLSVSRDGDKLISTQVRDQFQLRIFSVDNPAENRVLANASGASFSSGGKIFFTSRMSGNDEIWSIDQDGSGLKQLTNDPGGDIRPVASSDGKNVYFASNRSGAAHVWRMNADGSDQTQITKVNGGFPIAVSPDGDQVFFHHGIDRTLWKISTASGEETKIIDQPKYRFAISPDSSRAAYSELRGEKKYIVVVSLADGNTVKTIDYQDSKLKMPELVWKSDGDALYFMLTDAGFSKFSLWEQNLDGSPPRLVNELGSDGIAEGAGLAVSRDSKYFTIVQGGWKHDAVYITGLR